MYLVTCDGIMVSFKPGLAKENSFIFSIIDLLLRSLFSSVVLVIFASWQIFEHDKACLKLSGIKQLFFISITDSVGQEFRQSTGGMYLRSPVSGASTGKARMIWGDLTARSWNHLSSLIPVTRAGMAQGLYSAGVVNWSSYKWPQHAA